MNNNKIYTNAQYGDHFYHSEETNPVVENRLEILAALSQSLLQEIESLKHTEASQIDETIDLALEVERYEKNLIRSALKKTGGRQRRAAKLLNTKVSTLNNKIKRYNLS